MAGKVVVLDLGEVEVLGLGFWCGDVFGHGWVEVWSLAKGNVVVC